MRKPYLLVGLLPFFVTGCLDRMEDTVAVRPVFKTYDRVAIISRLERDREDVFIPLYMKAFPDQSLVERRDVADILGEQDILPDRLDDATRAKLRKILGVKAIVFPNFSAGSKSQLALKIIDTETGEIAASTTVSGKDYWDGSGTSFKKLVSRAIDVLKADLLSVSR